MSNWHKTEFDFLPERAFRPRGWKCGMTLEGGGGSNSAPPPDPRLVQAQIDSLGYQNKALQAMTDNANQMQPLQMKQMQDSIANAEDTQAYNKTERDKFTAVTDPLIKQAQDFNQDDRAKQLYGQATSDIDAGFSSAQQQKQMQMARMGINPNSGAATAANNDTAIAHAQALAAAGVQTQEAARQEGLQYRTTAANILGGFPAATQASSGLGLSMTGAPGSSYAPIVSGAGSMGQNAGSTYGAQLNAFNQQGIANANNASSQQGAMVGAGVTLAVVI